MRRTLMTAAVLAATLGAVALPAAASADPYYYGGGYGWHGGWDHDRDWRRDDWRAREWREYHRYGYGYGGYYGRPYAYVRPPVVYVDPYRY